MPTVVSSSQTGAAIDSEWLVNQIAHALRNPIFAATVQAEALALKARGQDGLVRSAEMVQGQLARLEQDLQEMLLLGRPARIQPRPTDLVAVAKRVAEAFRTGGGGEPADVRLTGEARTLGVFSDENAIRIILDRLLANAVQHTPSPHTVELEVASAENERATIELRDHGDGIPPDLLGKVFLPFFPQHRGRPGLGLAVAAKFAQAIGGQIEIESDLESGTIARLVIPIDPQITRR